MSELNDKMTMRDTLKLALGVAGALAGVGVIVVLLLVVVNVAVVKPEVAGALTDPERYELLAKARAEDERLLTTYGWMDKSKGIVRIPVDVAMRRMAEESGTTDEHR